MARSSSPVRTSEAASALKLHCVLTERLDMLRRIKRLEDENRCGGYASPQRGGQTAVGIRYVEAALGALARISAQRQGRRLARVWTRCRLEFVFAPGGLLAVPTTVHLRAAVDADLPDLVDVEVSATTRYFDAGFEPSLVQPRSESDLRELLLDTLV